MRLLVVHQNFPGQFGRFVSAWKDRPGWDVRAIGREFAPGLPGFEGLVRYKLARAGRPQQHPYLRQMEAATLHGQATARVMLGMKAEGFTPDVILAHPGWGETLYARDVFPSARLIHLCEWYYAAEGADVGFDPEFPTSFDDRARIRTWNALHLLNLEQCDKAIAPTQWQRSRHPASLQSKMVVCHEGIATSEMGPDPHARLKLPSGLEVGAGDPVITFVARNLEPYRGFHVFMRALQRMQRAHRTMQAIVIGGDGVSYGKAPRGFPNWRERMLSETEIDLSRVHFTGKLPVHQYRQALRVSSAHVYLTYPFVLSWSLLEVMAAGVPIVASNTEPVLEVLDDGRNASLVDFFDVQALSDGVLAALEDRSRALAMAERARSDVKCFDEKIGREGYERLIGASLADAAQ